MHKGCLVECTQRRVHGQEVLVCGVVVNVEGVATLLGYLWQARGCCNAADKNHTQSDDYG
jgi:hypothetical protein